MGKTVKDNKNFTSDMYEDAQDINKFKIKNKKSDIAKLEDDRMGNGRLSTLGGYAGGLGRTIYQATANNVQTSGASDLSIMRPLSPQSVMRSTEGDLTPTDLTNTKSLLSRFNPDNKSLGNGNENVDPTKKTKG
jgi:hypothetical protein